MPLIYIAQSSTLDGIDLVDDSHKLSIKIKATSYRKVIIPTIQLLSSTTVVLATTSPALASDPHKGFVA